MNPVSDEIKSYLEFNPDDPASCLHYGVKRRSGRYPWGSGQNPYQHSGDFLSRVEELEKSGKSQTEIARELGMTTTDFRVQKSLAKEERRKLLVARAEDLRAKGYSLNEIARQMGYDNDSSVRSLLNDKSKERMLQAKATADYLKDICDEKGIIDVGKGSEKMAGCSEQQMEKALYILQTQGYEVYGGGIPQATNQGQQTTGKFLCPPGTEYKEIYNFDNVHLIDESNYILTEGGQKKRKAFEYPTSLDPKRLQVVYAEQGGLDKDGLIELRRGVEDISLGNDHYSQVRILVDGTHYIKGMARYADDLPDGVDVRFNTNKPEGTPVLGEDKLNTVLKPIKSDPNNPFGSAIKERGGQRYYDDPNGKFTDPVTGEKQSLSIINKTKEEGDVAQWSKKLPSQFLGKQSDKLIKQQLDLTKANYISDYDEICNLTNPTVKKKLLESFARECDSAAEHLQAAALPRAKYEVILPLTDIKDTEVFAPNYRQGEKVALVRFPHEGTSQIPILTVNNKSKEGLSVIGADAKDAVGISSKVAQQLSGADFDGDTVMVIPTGGKNKIIAKPQFEGLKDFDPKIEYGPHSPGSEGTTYRKMRNTQTEMGIISNLITDMTLKGASEKELTKAMRHSMTVIDAEKHGLDYKRSEIENDIPTLKKIYQGRIENGKYREGASTLLSRAKGEISVPKRQGSPKINEDGSLSWKTADNLTYVDPKTGKVKTRTQQSTQMREAKDAMELVSDLRTRQELAYADYANFMKDLGKKARKEYLATNEIKYNPTAAKTYAPQVTSLNAKLEFAERNAPLERKANMIAKTRVDAQKQDNPAMSKAEIKKANQLAIEDARNMVGAKRHPIEVTDKEWECIQGGGISPTKLRKILNFMDDAQIKEMSMPKTQKGLSNAKIAKIQQMRASGYTISDIADDLGVSTSTITKYLN